MKLKHNQRCPSFERVVWSLREADRHIGEDMEIRPLAEIEKEIILQAIMATGSIAQAAVKLRISRSRIQRILRKYGLALKANEIHAELRKQRKLL